MTAHNVALLTGAFFAGGGLGLLFFGGLWLTVRYSFSSAMLGPSLAASFLVRVGISLAGMRAIYAGDWRRLVACLIGFLVARVILVRLARGKELRRRAVGGAVSHAP